MSPVIECGELDEIAATEVARLGRRRRGKRERQPLGDRPHRFDAEDLLSVVVDMCARGGAVATAQATRASDKASKGMRYMKGFLGQGVGARRTHRGARVQSCTASP
ncbi:hypothetical protein GCM10009105_03980 [Dokdonella soli]|uniref:Transposase n=1 Tax=Dokdonella soli TaxID=529810 RepID=A0ABN1IC48_9GAMM